MWIASLVADSDSEESVESSIGLEDEEIVQRVQKGVGSRFYKSGRFSPRMEKGVHHFHTLISKFMFK